jgi:4-hydroxy-tetrahydrodipicolinate reductase
LVIGTTGLTPEQEAVLSEASSKTAIVYAANMSVGVNVLLAVTEQVAGILGDDFDIEIFEMHHRHKVDAPSGTALAFGKAAAKGRGVDLDQVSARGRDGVTGARNSGDIGFAVQRGGSVVGEHSVLFASDQERVTISHKADDRSLFASGAVRAAMWVANKPPGLYGMKDVLGL